MVISAFVCGWVLGVVGGFFRRRFFGVFEARRCSIVVVFVDYVGIYRLFVFRGFFVITFLLYVNK